MLDPLWLRQLWLGGFTLIRNLRSSLGVGSYGRGGGGGGDGHIPKAGVTSRSDCKTQCDNVQSWNVNDKCAEKGDSYCVDRKLVPDQFHSDNSIPVCHVMHKTDLSGLCQSGPQCENQKDLDSDHPSLDPGPSNDGPRGLNPAINIGHQGLNTATQDSEGLNQLIPSSTEVKVNVKNSDHCEHSQVKLIYDTKYCGFEDKFTSSILYANHKGSKGDWEVIDNDIHQLWSSQVDFKFGFVPLQKQVLPAPDLGSSNFSESLLQVHDIVKKFWQAKFFTSSHPYSISIAGWGLGRSPG